MAGGGQQQSGNQDNATDILWIVAGVFILALIIWYFFHAQIISFVFQLKIMEARVIEIFDPKISDLKNAMLRASPEQVKIGQVLNVCTAIGEYLRYPLCAILMILAVFVYRRSAATRFCRVFNMKSLYQQEKSNWPYAEVALKQDLVKQDINSGPWAMALTAMQFSKKHKLLDIERKQLGATGLSKELGYEAMVNKHRAHSVFVTQLGALWKGTEVLLPHRRALLGIFAAKALGDRDAAEALLRQIASSAAGPSLNLSGADKLLKKHQDHKVIQEIMSRHAFEYGVFAVLLELARTDGVLASAEFLWLKPVDRPLWYVLNSVGRQTVFPEVAGIFAHLLAEKTIGYKLLSPMVEEAVKALEDAINDMVYVPTEEETANL